MTLINKGSNSLSVGDSTNVEVRVRSDFEAVKQIIATLIYDRSALEFIKGDLVGDNPARVSASSNPAPFYCPRVYKFDDKKCKGSKKGLIDNKFTCGGLRKTVNVSEGTCKTEKEWEVFMLQSCRGVDGIDDTEDQCNLRAATPAPAVGVVITDPRNPNNYIQSWNKPVGGKWFPYDTSHPNTVVLDALTVPSGFITSETNKDAPLLATLTFKALKEGQIIISIDPETSKMISRGNDQPLPNLNFKEKVILNVTQATPKPTPSPTPASISYCTPQYKFEKSNCTQKGTENDENVKLVDDKYTCGNGQIFIVADECKTKTQWGDLIINKTCRLINECPKPAPTTKPITYCTPVYDFTKAGCKGELVGLVANKYLCGNGSVHAVANGTCKTKNGWGNLIINETCRVNNEQQTNVCPSTKDLI